VGEHGDYVVDHRHWVPLVPLVTQKGRGH
jgi:hypothetical protein